MINKGSKLAGIISLVLFDSQVLAQEHNMTLKYEMIKNEGHYADITVRVNDTFLRTDYELPNNKLTELTVKWDGQYVLDNNKKIAYFMDYDVVNKKAKATLKQISSQVPNFTEDQIFAMSVDPSNDEDEYIEYSQSGDNKLAGNLDSDFIHEIGYLEVPNKYVSQKQYNWLISRSFEDKKFGQGFVMVLEQPITEVMRRLNYQYPVFPVYLKTDQFTLHLKSVDTVRLNDEELKVDSGLIIKDVTLKSIQFSELLSGSIE